MSSSCSDISTDYEDGSLSDSEYLGQSVNNSEVISLVCLKPGCEHLQFQSEVEHRNHLKKHVSSPKVVVSRLDQSTLRNSPNFTFVKQEPLKVRLKLRTQAGSDKPSFEVVKNSKQKLGQGDFGYLNGFHQEPETEFPVNNFTTDPSRPSERKPDTKTALDETSTTSTTEEREDRLQNLQQEEEDNSGDNRENDLEEEEEEEDDEDNDDNDDDEGEVEEECGGSREKQRRNLSPNQGSAAAPSSPTPSEVLRPRGFLAPDHLVDDDSCYSRSPLSPTRMVEMNGSTASAVSGSDNDSGHSRSPSAFPGTSGTGSGGEEDASGQQFNWDDLVNQASSGHDNDESNNSHENAQTGEAPVGDVNDIASDIDASDVASNMLSDDPLLLPENTSSADGEQDNLNLLQGLTSDPIPSDVDRGGGSETEYMSLDRLAEAGFCCEVCGERSQDRRVLDEHRALAGHYKCLMMPECSSIVWATAGELAAHQSSIHGVSPVQAPQSSPHTTPPQTSPRGSGTPPVQQLAQQVQRLAMPQQIPQSGYPTMPGAPYPPQVGQMMPQMMPQRRPPPGYRMPMPGQPGYAPGSPNQQQPGFSGSIQPRPLNTLVAGPRGAPRLPQGGVMPPRGMVPMVRGQKRPGPLPGSTRAPVPPAAKQRRVEGMIPPQQDNGKKSDANAVANILATRGITVTPAGGGGGTVRGAGVAGQPTPQVRQRQNMHAPAPPPPVPTLNLNSAISIIPTTGAAGNGRQQNNSGFAVPQARSLGRQPVATTNVERPPRPPTVDLTGDGPTPPPGSTRLQMVPTFHRGRGRPSNISRTTCQICDKVFASPEMLNQHMAMHRGPGKLPFRCNLCNAQYPTNQGLQQHRQTYHKEVLGMNAPLVPGEEMVIPLVDLKQPGVAQRLGQLGIHHCIPLSGLGNQSNGFFSLPVVSIDGSRSAAAGNLRSLGATGVLSIGPIKLVPK